MLSTNEDELRRLNSGPSAGEQPRGIALVRFFALCAGDAPRVLERCKEVMRAVLVQTVDRWPTDEKWHSLLPAWFVATCPDEDAVQEAGARWFELSAEEQSRLTNLWSVSNWVYWFLPDERQWFWWDASMPDANTIELVVEVFGDPFPSGSLDWLLAASGVIKTERERLDS